MSTDEFYYLPRAAEPSAWNVEILGAGRSEIRPHQRYPATQHPLEYSFIWEEGRTLPAYQVIYITRGSGVIETERTPLATLVAPVLVVLFPNIWHRYRPNADTGWNEHWIGFDGPLPQQMQSDGILSPDRPLLEIGRHPQALPQFQLVLDELKGEALGFRRIAASSVLQILALATSLPLRSEEENQPMRAVVREACAILRERSDQIVTIESLAAELNVGYTYFRRMFKQYTGFSPKQYHTQLRFERVKRLLQDARLSISEIAHQLEFDSPFHLSQWFKKLANTPPSQWRRQQKL